MKTWWQNARAKGQELVRLYGNIALYTMLGIMFVWYAACYVVIDQGVDLSTASFMGTDLSGFAATGGKAPAAFALYKVFMPLRIALAAALTPVVARIYWRFRPPEPAQEAAASEESA